LADEGNGARHSLDAVQQGFGDQFCLAGSLSDLLSRNTDAVIDCFYHLDGGVERGADQLGESTSTPQNKPNESRADNNAEVAVFNGDAINDPIEFAPGVPGSKPNPQPFPDMTTPVEPGPPIGESPPPTT